MESRGKKVLIGCGIGCLAVIVLAIGSCATFVYWLNRPGEMLEPELLVGGDTAAYAAWTMRLEDPGTREFTQAVINTMQDEGRRQDGVQLPAPVEQWLTRYQRDQTSEDLEKIFPVVAAWTLTPGSGEDDDLNLFTLSLMNAGNRMVFTDWILGLILSRVDDESEVEVIEYREEKIYRFISRPEGDIGVFLRGSDIFFASDVPTAKRAVDRLLDPESSEPAPTILQQLFLRIPQDTPLRGAIGNRRGELDRVLQFLGGGTGQDALRRSGVMGMSISGRFADSQTFRMSLEFLCTGPSSAEAAAERIPGILESILEPSEFDFRMDTATDREWVRVDVEFSDLVRQVEQFLKSRAVDDHRRRIRY